MLPREAEKEANEMMMNTRANQQSAVVGEPGAAVAPEKESSKKIASGRRGAPKARKGATKKAGKKTAPANRKSVTPQGASKGAKILEMIGRTKGATLAEIMKAIGWQAHSVRGFISTAAKKHGVKIESSKGDTGDRVYRTAN